MDIIIRLIENVGFPITISAGLLYIVFRLLSLIPRPKTIKTDPADVIPTQAETALLVAGTMSTLVNETTKRFEEISEKDKLIVQSLSLLIEGLKKHDQRVDEVKESVNEVKSLVSNAVGQMVGVAQQRDSIIAAIPQKVEQIMLPEIHKVPDETKAALDPRFDEVLAELRTIREEIKCAPDKTVEKIERSLDALTEKIEQWFNSQKREDKPNE
jgi:uncharacterized phage infection (PIP) family protein YhgE